MLIYPQSGYFNIHSVGKRFWVCEEDSQCNFNECWEMSMRVLRERMRDKISIFYISISDDISGQIYICQNMQLWSFSQLSQVRDSSLQIWTFQTNKQWPFGVYLFRNKITLKLKREIKSKRKVQDLKSIKG